MTFIAFLIYIPLQIMWIPIAILAAAWVAYKQIVVSKKLGVSQTAIEIINGRWTMDVFGMRADAAARKLMPVLPNSSARGLFMALFPLYVLYRISGRNLIYPRIAVPGKETLADLVMARTPVFDALIDKHSQDAKQFVLLGGGLDTRAYNGLADSGLSLFELDQAATQRLKIDQLKQAGVDASHVTFVEVDFADGAWMNDLAAAGFDPAQKTIFLWEGVTLYLSTQDVGETIAALRETTSGNSVLLADIYANNFVQMANKGAMGRTLDATGEAMSFGLDFAGDYQGALGDFVAGQGCSLGESYFLGADSKKGPFAVVVEMRLTASA